MARSLFLASLLVCVSAGSVLAGVPSPSFQLLVGDVAATQGHASPFVFASNDDGPSPDRCGCELVGEGFACQFRFRADGGLDCLTVLITLRDAFDTPVGTCSTSATITSVSANPADGCWQSGLAHPLCSCDGLSRGGVTDDSGVVSFTFCRLGGHGVAEVRVTSYCVGTTEICRPQFSFSSPDLDGECDGTTVLDLAIWAGCLGAGNQCRRSDYDCDCLVNIIDMGVFAGGLGVFCSP